ncbi:stalk domain-containing protein [Paenibacillus thalictri]|nr:stalk domain-containing protein [Paenibacillus thalictri]
MTERLYVHWTKRALFGAAALCMSLAWSGQAKAADQAGHTPGEIIAKWDQYRPKYTGSPFIETPLMVPPYSTGKLNAEFIQDGVNMANYVRFLAGLPDDLVADPQLNNQAQYGAVLLAVRDKGLSHYPEKPPTVDDGFYKIGYQSTSSSNLYMGLSTLHSTVLGYMSDSDMSNIDRVGHRRWILNPPLKKIGFGFAQGNAAYSPMQVFDKSGSPLFSKPYVAWPSSGAFPTNSFKHRDAWSISLNPDQYKVPSADKVKVVLTRKADGKVWTFGQKDKGIVTDPKLFPERNYFNVETSGFGIANCIIFRPAHVGSIVHNDEYDVQITGIETASGAPTAITYTVRFFDIPDKDEQAAFLSEWAKPNGEKANLTPVVFQSADFEKMIRTMLEKPQEPVTEWDLSRIPALDFDYGNGDMAKDAGLLKKFTHIKSLKMLYTKDADVSFISDLKDLRDLTLRNQNNTINGVEGIAKLNKLKLLYLQGNLATTQLAALLSNMHSLQQLDIWSDAVTDLTFVPEAANLRHLSVGGKSLQDVSSLSRFNQLQELGLHSNAIQDYSQLAKLPQLYKLDLTYVDLPDIAFVTGLSRLRSLDISGNQISSLAPLSSLANLETLTAHNNRIRDLTPLSGLSKLKTLQIASNGISDISPLFNSSFKLQKVDLNYNFLDTAAGSPVRTWLDSFPKGDATFEKQQQLKVKSLRLSSAAGTSSTLRYMLVGESIPAEAVSVYNDYSEKAVGGDASWESSNSDTVSVESGVITAKKRGYASIKVSATDMEQTFNVTVLDKHTIDSYVSNMLTDASRTKMKGMVVLAINNSNAFVQGSKKTLQAKPLIDSENTMLPVRFVSENLGAEVAWDAETQTITITGGGNKISITVDASQMTVNETKMDLPVPAKIIQDNTYLPLRVLCEALGKQVSYRDGVIIIAERNYEQDDDLYAELQAMYER